MDQDIRSRFRRPGPGRAAMPPRGMMPRPIAKTAAPLKPRQAPQLTSASKPRRKSRWARRVLSVGIILLLAAGAGAAYYFYPAYRDRLKLPHKTPVSNEPVAQQNETVNTPTELIRLVAVGDSIAYTSVNNAAKQADGSYNYLPMMQSLKPVFDKSDVRFCSQATPSGGVGLGASGAPKFNAPTEFAKGLSGLGCNAIGLATDHMNDKGQPGVDATRDTWDGLKPLAVAGANKSAEQQNGIQYFTVKGLKFALLAYTVASAVQSAQSYSVNMYSEQLADAQIKEARGRGTNFILVSMHWGSENTAEQNIQQDTIAQALAAKNIDIIFGHGPHVIQPVKVLNGEGRHQTLVWFSLGNFLNSQIPVETLIGGFAVMDINAKTQEILNPRFLPTYMHYEWTPEQKKRQSEADVLARRNFQLVLLDQAGDLLAKSQNNTTIAAQQERLKGILNRYLPVPVITSSEY